MKKYFVILSVTVVALAGLLIFQGAEATNLIDNGNFENPEVDVARGWEVYPSGTAGMGWTVEWYADYPGAPVLAHLEIHEDLLATAVDGDQYVELDSDWGYNDSAEKSNITIWQEVETCEGGKFILTYSWLPRNIGGTHSIDVLWNGKVIASHSGTASEYPDWTHETIVVTGTGGMDKLAFSETGNPDQLGMLFDAVVLEYIKGSCDFTYQCDAGFLLFDTNQSNRVNDLYLVDKITGIGEYKKTYNGPFYGEIAVGTDAKVYSIDTTNKKVMQLMPDGTTQVVVQIIGTLPKVEYTLAVAPNGIMYMALQNDDLYSIDLDTGISVKLVDLTGKVDVNGGDIVVDENNVMTVVSQYGPVWAVDLYDYSVKSLGTLGTSKFTGLAIVDGVYYATNQSQNKVYSFTHDGLTLDNITPATDPFGYNFGPGDAASCAPERLEASIMIEKSAEGFVVDSFEVNISEEVTYTYKVTNTGYLPLDSIIVTDDKCSTVTYVGGDVNSNYKLDLNEIFYFECTSIMDQSGLVVNIGTVTAYDPFGDLVDASDTFTTVVKAKGCTLTQGYWKTHSTHGPAPEDEAWGDLADNLYANSGFTKYQVLWTPVKGNAWYNLAHQNIAAWMNHAQNSAWMPTEVHDALVYSWTLLNAHKPDELEMLKGKKSAEFIDLRNEFISLAGILGNYNEGGTEVPHCSDIKLIETLEVLATSGSGIDSVNILELGKSYLLKVSGIHRFANWGEYGIADAEWSYRKAQYTPNNIAGWIKGEGYFASECGLDLQVDGCVDWGSYSPSNEYEVVIPGDGSAVHFWIHDSHYGDNSGSLTVNIYEL